MESDDDRVSGSSSAEKERKKNHRKIMKSLIKVRPFKKNKEATLEEKLAASELGVKILERESDG